MLVCRILLIVFFFVATGHFAQALDSAIRNRLSNIGDSIAQIQRQLNDVDQHIDRKISDELHDAKDEIDDTIKTHNMIVTTIGVILGLGLLGGLTAGRVWVIKIIRQAVENIVAGQTATIQQLIHSQSIENQMKGTKKLVVICGDLHEGDDTEKLLRKMGFRHITVLQQAAGLAIPPNDLIIITNHRTSLTEPEIIAIVDNGGPDEIFIYYGGRLNGTTPAHINKLNFANNQYTLYHHIINTMSFKQVFNV
ncbi:hypothetical protein SAMN05518672_1065 [Chitinophaga sp. CF118]|uniref:NARF domain-containing protein n=1 Tax=Chitinophaga sp. CF118 TaxID=1884367 RepID=UPI0008EA1913|nr:NARF domain-containing protein [Chitinophaga sp. CF118]SFE40032.1 hypothetical protein SAMN05518672_1065 [Chitinophaga sp. CF118]